MNSTFSGFHGSFRSISGANVRSTPSLPVPLPPPGQVAPRDRPQSRIPLQFRQGIRAQLEPERVEVDVARLHDRPVHVDGAVPLLLPAAEDPVPETVRPGAEDRP